MYKKQCFFLTLRRIGNSKSGIWNQDTFAISGNWELSRKNMFLQNTLRSRPLGISGKSGHFRIFSEMSQICKSAKKCKKTQNAKVSRKTLKFWCFIENSCGDLSKHWKSVENDIRNAHLCTLFFRNSRHFGGFRDFQLRIEVKFRKSVFRRFWKKFSLFLRFTGWRSTAPFLHGAKIWTSLFFRKVRNTFSVFVRFCAALPRKSVRTKMTPTDYPYRPRWGVSFPYAFLFRFRLWNGVKKKWTVLQYYYRIWK
jgi:hypothetical protein